MNLKGLTKEKILKISVNNPEKIFNGEIIDIKKIYRQLSILWHPDKNHSVESSIVFSHISLLYHSAIKKYNNGTLGQNKNIIEITSINGDKFSLKFYKEMKTEIADLYISDKFSTWKFPNSLSSDIINGLNNLKNISFNNEKMKNDFKKYVPTIKKIIKTTDFLYVVFEKESRFINLADILSHFGNKMDSKHVAWVMSVLYNQICFFHYNKIMIGGLSLENIFIDPKMHDGIILGGWWYSLMNGEKLVMLPKETFDIAPISMLNNKKADLLLDLEAVKLIGIKLLGFKNAVQLRTDKSVPEALKNWLDTASYGEALKDYAFWFNTVLPQSFGKRNFVEMNINLNDIYTGE